MSTFFHAKSGELVNLDRVRVIDDPYRDGNLVARMDDGESYAVRFDVVRNALRTVVPASPDDKGIIVSFPDGSAGEATVELHKVVAWTISPDGDFPRPIFTTADETSVSGGTVGLLRPDMKITLLGEDDSFDTTADFVEFARNGERRIEAFAVARKAAKEAKAKGGAA